MTTVEGLGSTAAGLSTEQDRLSKFHGTQCGYCTPGMVMSMHGLRKRTAAKDSTEPVAEEVENLLDGNICRCTGYRPILDAFKSFSPDAPDDLKKKLADIEDLAKSKKEGEKTCPKSGRPCVGSCSSAALGNGFSATVDPEQKWHQPNTLQELLGVLKSIPDGAKYILQGGNTGAGVYEELASGVKVYIDVNRVKELRQVVKAPPLSLGGAITLFEAMEAMTAAAEAEPAKFSYLRELVTHWGKVANVAVRAAGTLAGNFMMKHAKKEFPSDLFVDFEAAGAQIVVADQDGNRTRYSTSASLLML